MSDISKTKMQRLRLVLESYGADISRWPPKDRECVAVLKQEPRADLLFLQAAFLDQLLDLSASKSDHVADHGDLQTRILADFDDFHAAKTGEILVYPTDKKSALVAPDSFAPGRGIFGSGFGWGVGAALAACFVFGLYLGGIGLGDWRLDPTDNFAALASVGNTSSVIGETIIFHEPEEELL